MHKGSHIFLKHSDYPAIHLKKKTNKKNEKRHQQKNRGLLNAISTTIPDGNKSLSTIGTVRHAQLLDNHLFL